MSAGSRARRELSPDIVQGDEGQLSPSVSNATALMARFAVADAKRRRMSSETEHPVEDNELEVLQDAKMSTEAAEGQGQEEARKKKTDATGTGGARSAAIGARVKAEKVTEGKRAAKTKAANTEGDQKAAISLSVKTEKVTKSQRAAKTKAANTGVADAPIPTRSSARLAKIKEEAKELEKVDTLPLVPGTSRQGQVAVAPSTVKPAAYGSKGVVKKQAILPSSNSNPVLALTVKRPLVKVSRPFFHENVADWPYFGNPITTHDFNNSWEGLKSNFALYHEIKIMCGGKLLDVKHEITKEPTSNKFNCVYKVSEYVRRGSKEKSYVNHFATIRMKAEAGKYTYFVFHIVSQELGDQYHINVRELRKACEVVFGTQIFRCEEKGEASCRGERELGTIHQSMNLAAEKVVNGAIEN